MKSWRWTTCSSHASLIERARCLPMPLTSWSLVDSSEIIRRVSSPKRFTIRSARPLETPLTSPLPRYLRMPYMDAGSSDLKVAILNWSPCVGCFVQVPWIQRVSPHWTPPSGPVIVVFSVPSLGRSSAMVKLFSSLKKMIRSRTPVRVELEMVRSEW